jgi:fermentation-respiration switch protein FrsA (DUF1100 family)
MLIAVTAVALAAALGAPLIRWAGRQVLFPAPAAPARSAAEGRDDVEVVTLPSGTEAFFLAPHGAGEPASRHPVLVYTHGNGELIDFWLDDFEEPRRWGLAVLLVEYPGYGRSPGRPSEDSIRRTMIEALTWIRGRADLDESRIVAHGRSLGGGAAVALAAQGAVAALILESTFSSVRKIARSFGVPGFLVLDPFDNRSVVREFPGPILGIHGSRDRVIPFEHAEELRAAARSYRLIRLDCGHNDCPSQWREIGRFLAEHAIVPSEAVDG